MFERILIPTDGSENVADAIEKGVAIATQFDASVHALSVVPHVVTRDRLRYDPETAAADAVEAVEKRCREEGLDVRTETRKGNAPQEILVYSQENEIDLIVMGTHGRTGLNHAIIGSVAERVVRNSSIPVLTVRPEG